MKDVIAELFEQQTIAAEKLSKIMDAIKALQDLCEHDMQPNGHDSHYNHEKCSLCGYEDLKC